MKLLSTTVFTLAITTASFANTWTVDDDGNADFNNIQAAVDAAQDGDEIVVMPGTYTSTEDEVIDMRGKDILLRSSKGPTVTIIDGEGTRRGIYCPGVSSLNPIIQGFTITNGFAVYGGGGMYNVGDSSLTVTDCTFTNNHAHFGGGMYNDNNSSPTLTNCTFISNTAGNGGGMYNVSNSSSPTLTGCKFESNTATDNGGGMYSYAGSHTLTNCIFENNNADYGGGMYNTEGTPMNDPTMTNCTFKNNTATYGGGGMCNFFEATTTLTYCTFMDNDANNGGGIFNYYGSTTTLTNCVFETNAANYGGGIYNAISVSWISNSSFCLNDPDHIYGAWVDLDGNTFDVDCDDDPPFCMADVNEDYNVDVLDLLYVIAVWGTDNPAGDINADGVVNIEDLLELIGAWGVCP